MRFLKSLYENYQKQPEAIAFQSRAGSISYAQLWAQSDKLASWIQAEVNDDSPVVVYGHMQPEMLVSFIACLKAGHPYIPVDESMPLERLQQIIDKSKSSLLLSATKLDLDMSMLTFQDIVNIPSVTNSNREVQPEDVVYIIFTSGSTGTPKGVQITSECLDSFIDWMTGDFQLKDQQVFLNQAPFSFDLSIMDLYTALALGGTVYAIDKGLVASPKELFPYIMAGDVDVWVSTPSFLELCLMNKEFTEEYYPTIKAFLFCGEVLLNDTAGELNKRFPQAEIFNTYGPTEATVAVTSIRVTEEILSTYNPLPVGLVKEDCEILILGEDEVGEIAIKGPSVGKGYLYDEEKTAEVFSVIDNERVYRTGDQGYVQNGLLFYQGRIDFQIKLNGYRIEIEDIERNLKSIELIEQAIVIPEIKDGKCQSLTAFVKVGQHEFEKDYMVTSYLKKILAESLPAYMIPRKFVYREMLPITANGKMDRKSLVGVGR